MGKSKNDSRWVTCPVCGGRTRIMVNPDTVLLKFPLHCPKCKQETKISVVHQKMSLSK